MPVFSGVGSYLIGNIDIVSYIFSFLIPYFPMDGQMEDTSTDAPAGAQRTYRKYTVADVEDIRAYMNQHVGAKKVDIMKAFTHKGFSCPKQFRKVIKQIKDGKSAQDICSVAKGRGRKWKKQSLSVASVAADIRERAQQDPTNKTNSFRKIAKELGVSRGSVGRAMVAGGLKVLKHVKAPRTDDRIQKQRLEKCAELLAYLAKNPGAERQIWFSDESPFKCGPRPLVPQNDRILVDAQARRKDVDPGLLNKPQKARQMTIMVAAAISAMGGGCKTTLFLIPPKTRINADFYANTMCGTHYFPQIRLAAYKNAIDSAGGSNAPPSSKWIWQEDGASPRAAKLTQSMFDNEGVVKLPCWPADSPDLNPCDFWLWPALEAELKKMPEAKNAEELQLQLGMAWEKIEPDQIRKACLAFKARLEMCVKEEGRYFAHAMGK